LAGARPEYRRDIPQLFFQPRGLYGIDGRAAAAGGNIEIEAPASNQALGDRVEATKGFPDGCTLGRGRGEFLPDHHALQPIKGESPEGLLRVQLVARDNTGVQGGDPPAFCGLAKLRL